MSRGAVCRHSKSADYKANNNKPAANDPQREFKGGLMWHIVLQQDAYLRCLFWNNAVFYEKFFFEYLKALLQKLNISISNKIVSGKF